MASPVTLCRRPKGYIGDYCCNPVASCSVLGVAHESHDWLARLFFIEPEWRHCNGVSNPEKRAAG